MTPTCPRIYLCLMRPGNLNLALTPKLTTQTYSMAVSYVGTTSTYDPKYLLFLQQVMVWCSSVRDFSSMLPQRHVASVAELREVNPVPMLIRSFIDRQYPRYQSELFPRSRQRSILSVVDLRCDCPPPFPHPGVTTQHSGDPGSFFFLPSFPPSYLISVFTSWHFGLSALWQIERLD